MQTKNMNPLMMRKQVSIKTKDHLLILNDAAKVEFRNQNKNKTKQNKKMMRLACYPTGWK